MMRKEPAFPVEGDRDEVRRPLEMAAGILPGISMEIAIDLACDDWRAVMPDAEEVCRRAAGAALAGLCAPGGAELSIVLTDDEAIRALNREWRRIDAPTNVLAFPGDPDMTAPAGIAGGDAPPLLLGDVIVALETTQAEARRDARPLADHLAHLIVHGTLHLRGYDHENDMDAEEMEALETAILKDLGIEDPYEEAPADGSRLTGDDGHG